MWAGGAVKTLTRCRQLDHTPLTPFRAYDRLLLVTELPDVVDPPSDASPWMVRPFADWLTTFTKERKALGDSGLPPPIRAYLTQLETTQHREQSELPPQAARPVRP